MAHIPLVSRRFGIGALVPIVVLLVGAALLLSGVVGSPAGPNVARAPTNSPPTVTPASSAVPGSPTTGSGPSATPQASFPPLAAGVVPILYLHRVQAPPAQWLTWTRAEREAFLAYDDIPAAFIAQLDWLKAHGYQTILPRDLAAHWDHGVPLPPRPVIISLDDGAPSWIDTVLPALQQRGMVAEFYLTLSAIADHRMTWDEVRLLADAGMGIGCHDVHHVQLTGFGPGRPSASPATMWDEVHGCRVIVGAEIGTPPDSMAYVGGGFDATLMALVAKAGYSTARSILRGTVQAENDRYTLRVVAIVEHDDVVDPYLGQLVPGLPTFAAKMAGLRT